MPLCISHFLSNLAINTPLRKGMDNFADILKGLGEVINVPLHPDKHGLCKIVISHRFSVQIEYDPLRDRLLFISFIIEILPGKFRENVLREALKANGMVPRTGTLSYLEKNAMLVLSDYYYLKELKIDKLAEYFSSFVEKVDFWKTHLERGTVPNIVKSPSKELPSPFFKR